MSRTGPEGRTPGTNEPGKAARRGPGPPVPWSAPLPHDALGAPFEFGAPGVFGARFPDGVGTLCGGGGWDPGEATDDTQMAVLVGESLLENGGLELSDIFARFRRWAAGEPKDIGLQTEDVLTSGDP